MPCYHHMHTHKTPAIRILDAIYAPGLPKVIAKTERTSANRARNCNESLSRSGLDNSFVVYNVLMLAKCGRKNFKGFGTDVILDVAVRNSLTIISKALERIAMVTLASCLSFKTVDTHVSNRSFNSRSSSLIASGVSSSDFPLVFFLSPSFFLSSDDAVTATALESFGGIVMG